jgi:hypothetical protein
MNFKLYSISSLSLSIKASVFLLMMITSANIYAQNNERARTNVGLAYPLSSNWTNAPRDTNNFSLNLIGGVSAAEHGISIAGFSNIVHQDASGLQIAGFSNHIGKNAHGTMIAGFMNTYGSGSSVAVAGFANIARSSSGAQVAGFMNKSGDVSSLQLAGFLNVAKNVKGIQLGFINIADSADKQLGIINISKNGEKAIGVTINENQTTLLTFRSGGKILYGIVGIGYNLNNKKTKYAYEAGLGAHLLTIQAFRLNTELVSGGLESFKGGEYFKSSFRLMPAFKITPSIEIFGGPSFNYVNTDTEEGKKITKKYINSWTRNNGRDLYGFYVGYTAGVQVLF